MQLDQTTRQEILQIVTPHVGTIAERRGLVSEAFNGSSIRGNITPDNKSQRDFVNHLIDECHKFGKIENGVHSLKAFLTVLHKRVGIDKQTQINHILSRVFPATGSADESSETISNSDVYFRRGVMHQRLGNSYSAIAAYDECLELNPSFVDALCNRATVYLQLENFKKALVDYEQAINLQPTDDTLAQLYNGYGHALRAFKRYEDSIEALTYGLELPSSVKHHLFVNRAITYIGLSEYVLAINDCIEAISINADYHLAYVNLGVAHQRSGNFEEAIRNYDAAINLDSQDYVPLVNLGYIYLHLERLESAIDSFDKALVLDRYNEFAYKGRMKAIWLRDGQ